MQKLPVLAGVVVLGVVAAIAATYWAKNRAVDDVEQAFTSLRASGTKATHGAVEFDLFSRTLRIADIAIEPTAAGSVKTNIGKLTASGVSSSATGVSASRIEVADMVVKGEVGKAPAVVPFSQTIPKIDVVDFNLPRGAALAPGIGAAIATLSAASVRTPEVRYEFSMPGTTDAMKLKLDNFELKSIKDGYVGSLSAEKMSGTVPMPAQPAGKPGPTGPMTLEMTKYEIADIDLQTMVSLYGGDVPPRAITRAGLTRLQGKGSLGRYTIDIGQDVHMVMGTITSGDVMIDPAKVTRATVLDMLNGMPIDGKPATQAQSTALLGKMATLIEGVSTGGMEMRGLETTAKGPAPAAVMNVKLGSMSMGPLEKGRLSSWSMDGLAANIPGQPPMSIGHASLTGYDMVKLFRSITNLTPAGQPGLEMLQALEGFEVRDYTIPDPATGKTKATINGLKASWGGFVANVPTTSQLTLKMTMATDEPQLAAFKQRGFDKVEVNFDVATNWNEPTKSVIVSPFDLRMSNFGAVSGVMALRNSDPTPIGNDPMRLMAVAQSMELGPIELTVRDGGFVGILKSTLAAAVPPGMIGAPGVATPADPLAALRTQLINPAQPDRGVGMLLDTTNAFLAAPSQSLALRLTPKSKMTLGQVTGAAGAFASPQGLGAMLAQFNIDAKVGR